MAEPLITEYAGRRGGRVTRIFLYGRGGVRVMNGNKALRHVYRFDPSANMMAEYDIAREDRVIRRFMFDTMGMVEESFASGSRPQTYRYEAGGSRIVVREGGAYGAVGVQYTFEENGVAKTAWGRDGEIERVWTFERDTISERSGGWFGNVDRLFVFEGINPSMFREPEAFLQFLIFTALSDADRTADVDEQVSEIRSGKGTAGGSRYAYTGPRRTSSESIDEPSPASARPASRAPAGLAPPSPRGSMGRSAGAGDAGIDFIPDADAPGPVARGPPQRRSGDMSAEERYQRAREETSSSGRGGSADIPLEERFRGVREEDRRMSQGRSAEIPLDERFQNSRNDDRRLDRGASADIPLDERFEGSRQGPEKLKKGRSAEISYDERRQGR